MLTKFTKLAQILTMAGVASLFSIEVMAQTATKATKNEPIQVAQASEETPPKEFISLEQAFLEAYFSHAQNAYYESGILGQLNTILGFNRFPETQILLDGKTVDRLYRDALQLQVEAGMPLRTADLPNPYETSLRETSELLYGR